MMIATETVAPPWLRTRGPVGDDVIVTGRLTIDIGALLVVVDDAPVHPSGNELRLLTALALRLGRAVLYDELVRMIWWREYDPSDPAMRLAHEHILRVTTCRLRHRLGRSAAGLVVTIPGIGLRLERVPRGELRRPPDPLAPRATLAERGLWALAHARCIDCGSTARRHWAHGICEGCRPDRRPPRRDPVRHPRKDTSA